MLCYLLEDAKSDKIARDKAAAAFDAIINNLKTKKTSSYRSIKDGEAYVLDSVVLDLPTEIPSFKLVLRKPIRNVNGKSVDAGYSGNQQAIHVMIDLDEDWQTQLLELKTVILHEFIHHLDYLRSDGKQRETSAQSNKDYYNSDAEINAFYQEAIHEFEKLYSRVYSSHSIVTFEKFTKQLSKFDVFLKLVEGMADDGFTENWSEQTKKKFAKRVYGYYTDIYLIDVEEKLA